jgi:polar amino acid transport system ATP-binding protein
VSTPMVLAEGVHKRFGRLEVLRGISLEVQPGQVMCLLGPSGSGKSTFLRCINHLEKIQAGRLSVDGELVGYRQEGDRLHELREGDVVRKRAQIGMVFQRFNLFPHMTALQNVCEAPVQVRGIARAQARERGAELLARVGLGHRLSAYPSQLSGGQQQLVGVARAVIAKPRLILADEPTGNLHSGQARDVMELFARLNGEGTTIIQVTHSEENAAYGRRIVRLADGWIRPE